jgi:formamidopyrimidine-DNA glycosylase
MPELPEVEAVRREIAPWLTGRRILNASLVQAPEGPKYAHLSRAVGGRIQAVNRRGKFLVCPLSSGDELIIHLGMTGVLTPNRPEQHLRVALDLDDGSSLYFRDVRRFGRFCVAIGGDRRMLPTLYRMGPEPLSEAFTVEAFQEGLRSRSPIKTRLLSQRPVAGVGNIYADECLWRARIRPTKPAVELGLRHVMGLREAIVEVLSDAVAAGGTTFRDFETGSGKTGAYGGNLKVYGRSGAPCLRCNTLLSRSVVGQRATVWCRRCQC